MKRKTPAKKTRKPAKKTVKKASKKKAKKKAVKTTKKKSKKPARKPAKKPVKKEAHYLRIRFSETKDGSPEIYDFLFLYLPEILLRMGEKRVSLEIQRLEPLDRYYTNLMLDEKEIKKVRDKFAASHHLKETPTTMKANVSVKHLSGIFQDYNLLFDIFFTDLQIKGKNISFDLMDGFSNQLLAFGSKKALDKLVELTKEKVKQKASFTPADPPSNKT